MNAAQVAAAAAADTCTAAAAAQRYTSLLTRVILETKPKGCTCC
jgi:hypothetical protein